MTGARGFFHRSGPEPSFPGTGTWREAREGETEQVVARSSPSSGPFEKTCTVAMRRVRLSDVGRDKKGYDEERRE